MHNFKPFFVSLPTSRGSEIWSKGSLWLVFILSPVEKSKQNQSKNDLSYAIMSFYQAVSIPQGTQKNWTHYTNKKLPKIGIQIKFTTSHFFCFFSLDPEYYDIYFFLIPLFFNTKHFLFFHSLGNYLKDISLHFHVVGLILRGEIAFFLERINSRTPPNLILTHT